MVITWQSRGNHEVSCVEIAPLAQAQLEHLLRALVHGGSPLASLDLSGTHLCVTSSGRYATNALQLVCDLVTAPGSRLATLR